MLYEALVRLIQRHAEHRNVKLSDIHGSAADPWSVDLHFRLSDYVYGIRALVSSDVASLIEFGAGLGEIARDMFCPYPWDDHVACESAFQHAIDQTERRIDVSYLLERNGQSIGHFFLWKAGGNPQSRAFGLEVPELGVAIVDTQVGRGFGSLAVRFLLAVAGGLGSDAVELTTARDNEAGWTAYISAGFEYTGMLRVPLQVDVTAVEANEVVATRYRTERQMAHVLRTDKREAVLSYLARKRGEAIE